MAKSKKRVPEIPRDDDARAPQSPRDTTAGDTQRDRIAERAYQLYKDRGGSEGRALDDWLEAERELVRNRQPQNGEPPDSAA